MVAVADDERERRAERAPVPEPGVDLDLVGLDLLARAAAVALLAPAQVAVDRRLVEHEPGRETADDRDQRRAVRLACGDELEGHATQAYGRAHDLDGCGDPRPELERGGALRDEHLQPGDDLAPASRAARPVAVSGYGRSISV